MAFLNDDNLKHIWYPFYPRATWHRTTKSISKKSLIPIGVHELEIKSVVEQKTKKGGRKVELHIYKEPDFFREEDNDKKSPDESGKCSYDTIRCTHVPSYRPQGKLGNEWYKHFTMCLSNKDLDTMMTWDGQKKRFIGVVMHRQEHVQELKNGIYVNKVGVFDEPVVYWETILLSVHKLGEEVKINNYYDLFKPIRYDPMEDAKGETSRLMLMHNLAMVTGKNAENSDEIPF